MNCKQGDIAVIVGGFCPQNIGQIVRVIEPYLGQEVTGGQRFDLNEVSPSWIIGSSRKSLFTASWGFKEIKGPFTHRAIADKLLRPIRDQDGQDETLTWLDVPSKEIA